MQEQDLEGKVIMDSLTAFFLALAIVESNCNDNAIGKHGEVGRYQISQIYLDDVNRIRGEYDYYSDNLLMEQMTNEHLAELAVLTYINYYCEKCRKKTGKPITFEMMARIHNGGPYGYKKDCTIDYWQKVKKAMENVMEKK